MDFPGTSPYKDQRNLLKMFAIDYKLSTPNIYRFSSFSPSFNAGAEKQMQKKQSD